MSLIPGWVWLVGGAALLAGAALWHDSAVDDARIRDEAVGAARVQARWNAADAEAERVAAEAVKDDLAKERQQRAAAQKEIDDAHAETQRLEAELQRANATGKRLYDTAVRVTAARCRPLAPAAAAASGSPPAPGPGLLFADVLGGLEQDGRAMAEEARKRRIAALACEGIHDSLTNAQGGQP
jgi:hypothetical protein